MSTPRGARSIIAAATLALAHGCVTIPDDELARLDAIERDWQRSVPIEDGRVYTCVELQEAAIRRHPGLTATFHRYQAALQQIVLDGALDDPRVQFGWFLESVETRVGSQEWKAGVSQTFPFWGKRDLRAEIALHDAHQLREQLVEERLRIARDVEAEFWNLFFVDASASVLDQQVELLQRLAESIEAQFFAGQTSKADFISILMELERQKTARENLEPRRRDAMAGLNALIDRSPSAPLALAFADPGTLGLPAFDPDELIARARDFGPVQVQAHRILRQDAAVALAELGWYPDFSVGLDYIATKGLSPGSGMSVSGNGDDPTVLGFGMNLPIWFDKNEARVTRAEQLLEAERASRRGLIRQAERRAVSALEQGRRSEQDRVLYADQLLPKAEEKLSLSEQDYIGGRVDLDRLIGSERELLDLRLATARAIADREAALAELDYLTGGALGRLPEARPSGAEEIAEAEAMKSSDVSGEGVEP